MVLRCIEKGGKRSGTRICNPGTAGTKGGPWNRCCEVGEYLAVVVRPTGTPGRGRHNTTIHRGPEKRNIPKGPMHLLGAVGERGEHRVQEVHEIHLGKLSRCTAGLWP